MQQQPPEDTPPAISLSLSLFLYYSKSFSTSYQKHIWLEKRDVELNKPLNKYMYHVNFFLFDPRESDRQG